MLAALIRSLFGFWRKSIIGGLLIFLLLIVLNNLLYIVLEKVNKLLFEPQCGNRTIHPNRCAV